MLYYYFAQASKFILQTLNIGTQYIVSVVVLLVIQHIVRHKICLNISSAEYLGFGKAVSMHHKSKPLIILADMGMCSKLVKIKSIIGNSSLLISSFSI